MAIAYHELEPFKSGESTLILSQILDRYNLFKREVKKLKSKFAYRLLPAEFDQEPVSKDPNWDILKPEKLVGHIILGFSSNLGHQAAVGLTYIAKSLIDIGRKGCIINAFDFNRDVVNFDEGRDYIEEVQSSDFVVFYFINSIDPTDFKISKYKQIVEACQRFGKPLLVSFNTGYKHDLKLFEIKMTDRVNNPKELFEKMMED